MSLLLKTNFCGIELKNPTVLASGIWGVSIASMKRAAANGAGAVTTKSIGPKPRKGHANPTVLVFGEGTINAVGLPSPGYKNEVKKLNELKEIGVPVIVSIYGASTEEFVEVANAVAEYSPPFIELNISCPNSKTHGQLFGQNKDVCFDVVSKVKNAVGSKTKLIAKLTPNTLNIAEIARSCEEAGADAISAINTVGPGMIIDIDFKKPVLAFKKGGLGGPAIKPIAVRCIYDIFESTELPVIGIGGITTGRDAIEFMMAGATLAGIGSALYYRGIEVFGLVCNEIQEWMQENNYSNPMELVGLAHK